MLTEYRGYAPYVVEVVYEYRYIVITLLVEQNIILK